MKAQNESIGGVPSKISIILSGACPVAVGKCPVALADQKDTEVPELADTSWSGQPGEDLFFNSWKLLF